LFLQEVESVRGISIHPSGDFLLVATDHPTGKLSKQYQYYHEGGLKFKFLYFYYSNCVVHMEGAA